MGENEEKVGEVMISIIQKPAGFKIRRKGDVETFKNVCLCNGSKYIIKINPNYIFMLEKRRIIQQELLNKVICLTFSILKFRLMWMNWFGNCENISTKNIFRREYYIER